MHPGAAESPPHLRLAQTSLCTHAPSLFRAAAGPVPALPATCSGSTSGCRCRMPHRACWRDRDGQPHRYRHLPNLKAVTLSTCQGSCSGGCFGVTLDRRLNTTHQPHTHMHADGNEACEAHWKFRVVVGNCSDSPPNHIVDCTTICHIHCVHIKRLSVNLRMAGSQSTSSQFLIPNF